MVTTGNRICGFTQKAPRNARTCAKPLTIDLSETAQKRAGDIFGVLKAEASESNCDALVAHIEDALVRGVFESLRKLPTDASQEAILEAAVAKVNDALFRLLGEDGLSLGPETISGAVISQKGKDVSAAVWGRPSVLLFHPAGDGQVHIYDLVEDDDMNTKTGRGFSQIISGRITGKDRLLTSSDDLRNPLGDNVLAELVTKDDPETAANALRHTISEAKMSFGLSLFVSDGAELPTSNQRTPAIGSRSPRTKFGSKIAKSENSLEKLIATESQTNEIMSPPVLSTVGKGVLSGLRSAASWLPERMERRKQEKEEEAVIAGQKPSKTKKRNDDDDRPPTKTGGNDSSDTTPTQSPDNEPEAQLSVSMSPKETIAAGLTNLIEAVNDLPKLGKIGLVMMLTILSAINFSSIGVGWQKARQNAVKAYEYSLYQIEQKMDAAEASLIYHDTNRAKELLDQAESMIAEIPEDKKSYREDKQSLMDSLQEKREIANRAVRLNAPDVIASLNGSQGPLSLTRLAQMDKKVFVSSDDGQIFEINPTGGASAAAASPESPILFLADGQRLISATERGSLISLSPNGQPSSGTITWGDEPIQPKDAVVWGSRLYVLDPAHNRLLRHYAVDDGYGSPQFYLKDGTDVSKGVSMAVDGNLYVLDSDGKVTKLRLGERQDFRLEPVEPKLANADRIRTGENDENLWILDTDGSRLLCFNKETGELQAQYLHDRFTEADDFLVNEKAGEVLMIEGSDVLRFNLPR